MYQRYQQEANQNPVFTRKYLMIYSILSTLLLVLSIDATGQDQTSFSPVYKYQPEGMKILGKFSSKYYMVKGLHKPWKAGHNERASLFQNDLDLYQNNKVKFFDTLKNQFLTQYNQNLNRTGKKFLACSDSIIQTTACFAYQGVVWLYYVHKQGKNAVLKLQKFDLKGNAVHKAKPLMKTKLSESNEAAPFFIQMNGDIQRFLVLNNKRFKVFNTRMKKKFSGRIPCHNLRQIRLINSKVIYFIDQKNKNGKPVFDFVKYFPRIGTENRNQVEIKDQPVYDVIFRKGQRRNNIQLIGLGGRPFSHYFTQTFNRSTFKLQDQYKAPFDENVLEKINWQNNAAPFCVKTVKTIYDKEVMVIKEPLKIDTPGKKGCGRFILNTLRKPGKEPQTSLIKKSTVAPNIPDYYGFHLFSHSDELHGFFNQFSKKEHKGLFKIKYPGKKVIEPKKLLRTKEGGVIVTPRLIKKTGDNELLFFAFDQDEYRLIKYRFK